LSSPLISNGVSSNETSSLIIDQLVNNTNNAAVNVTVPTGDLNLVNKTNPIALNANSASMSLASKPNSYEMSNQNVYPVMLADQKFSDGNLLSASTNPGPIGSLVNGNGIRNNSGINNMTNSNQMAPVVGPINKNSLAQSVQIQQRMQQQQPSLQTNQSQFQSNNNFQNDLFNQYSVNNVAVNGNQINPIGFLGNGSNMLDSFSQQQQQQQHEQSTIFSITANAFE